jgi:hypothetical protein
MHIPHLLPLARPHRNACMSTEATAAHLRCTHHKRYSQLGSDEVHYKQRQHRQVGLQASSPAKCLPAKCLQCSQMLPNAHPLSRVNTVTFRCKESSSGPICCFCMSLCITIELVLHATFAAYTWHPSPFNLVGTALWTLTRAPCLRSAVRGCHACSGEQPIEVLLMTWWYRLPTPLACAPSGN